MTVTEVKQSVTAAAARYGVPADFALAIAERESAFGQNKGPSPAGAIGVMQLMPKTARSLGVNDPYDDAQNIDGGVRLLAQLLRQYNGDTLSAAAAYNWGSGNLASSKPMPRETTNYVSYIAQKLGLDSNPFSPVESSGGFLPAAVQSSPDDFPRGLAVALGVAAVAVVWMVA